MDNNKYSILMNSAKSKGSSDVNMGIGVNLYANKKILAGENVNNAVDIYETYINERKSSDKFRIILNIHPYCSNVLFNPITEIVKDEGSNDAICLNFTEMTSDSFNGKVIGKKDNFLWSAYDAIRDTQLSNDANGFTYHCGINIFNNHMLRNKTYKAVNFNDKYKDHIWDINGDAYEEMGVAKKNNYNISFYGLNDDYFSPPVYEKSFNTIDDYMRDRFGVPVTRCFYAKTISGTTVYNVPLHLYQIYDVFSFDESIKENLSEHNGWFGFSNKSTINSIMLENDGDTSPEQWQEETVNNFELSTNVLDFCDETSKEIDLIANSSSITTRIPSKNPRINKVLNNKLACEFVDMYPERELFSFTPNFNQYRQRLERNWDYCLTYPSKNIYNAEGHGAEFLVNYGRRTPALRVDRFDENVIDDNGLSVVTIYSISQHGLAEGDFVNLYKHVNDENELLYDNAEVIRIVDKYIFQIEKTENDISSEWVNLNQGVDFNFNEDTYEYRHEGYNYPVCASKWVSIDRTCKDLFFVKVVNGIECEYYVRQFSRLPNFKFSDTEINDYNVNKDRDKDNSLIKKFSDPSKKTCDFENHISKIGFSDTHYSDDVTQIVYTDDINISYLKDNLGRPLTDVYLTIVKRNQGYKKWYGIGGNDPDIGSNEVEYSHCFGKNQCQFLLSDFYRMRTRNATTGTDVRDLTVDKRGFSINETDEIVFDSDRDFAGDLCCYSPVDCYEKSIQNIMGRFNTVQREISSYNVKSNVLSAFSSFIHDEVVKDENSITPIQAKNLHPSSDYSSAYTEITSGYSEGYYYQMHYRIPLKDVSTTLSYDNPVIYDIYSMSPYNHKIKMMTKDPNELSLDERLMVYDNVANEIYYMKVSEIKTYNILLCEVFDEYGNDAFEEFSDIIENANNYLDRFVVTKRNENTPSYAKIIRDGSCRYYWRNVVPNGIEDDDIVYPFTNGAFYVTKTFNFFLRRQDPQRDNLAYTEGDVFDYVPKGEIITDYYDNDDNESYESGDVDDCDFDAFGPFKEMDKRYVINKTREKINNIIR